MADGIYDVTSEAIKLLVGPTTTVAQLQALERTTTEFTQGGVSAQEALEELGKTNAELLAIGQRLLDQNGPNALKYLLSFLALCAPLLLALYLHHEGERASAHRHEQSMKMSERHHQEIMEQAAACEPTVECGDKTTKKHSYGRTPN